MRLGPDKAGALYLLGLIEKQADNAQWLRKNADAIAAWKRVLEINPQHAQALYSLSRALGTAQAAEAQSYQARFAETAALVPICARTWD